MLIYCEFIEHIIAKPLMRWVHQLLLAPVHCIHWQLPFSSFM